MLAELSQGRSCGQTARGGRGTVCRVDFSYPERATVTTSHKCTIVYSFMTMVHHVVNVDGKRNGILTFVGT